MTIDEILDQLRGAPVASARATSRVPASVAGARLLLATEWYRRRAGGLQRLRHGTR